jgi:uncharacterized repeat protein (TIGR01451 family)
MIKKSIAFFLLLSGIGGFSQNILVSPTGDGGFETGTTFVSNGWTAVNDGTNTWNVGAATFYAGARSAYISNNIGAANAYTFTNSETSHFYRDLTVPSGETLITLKFFIKSSGQTGNDRLLIYTAPTSVTPVAGSPVSPSTTLTGATLVYTQTTFNTTYTLQTVYLPASLAGTTFRLIFTWQNDAATGTNPPAAVDNISLVSQTGQEYSTAGTYTFTVPAGVTILTVECWGGGGGTRNDGDNARGGGGGGAYASSALTVTPGQNYTVTVGAGGAPATTTGQSGGNSSFGSLVIAVGGSGGTNNGGAGGTVAASTGTIRYAGGNGGKREKDGGGGGGGGSAFSIAAGNNGANGTSTTGGTGGTGTGNGANGGNDGQPGNPGQAPGGGGGGRGDNGVTGGSGASGRVVVNWIVSNADLSIQKLASSMAPPYGSTITFTLTASNAGPANASGVTVNDLLPNGYFYLSHTPSGSTTYNPVTGIWTIGNLNNGSTATLTITATVVCNGTYANTATITGNEPDPVSGNNTVTVTPVPAGGSCPVYANDDEATTFQGFPVDIDVLDNDVGNLDPTTLTILTDPQNGSLQVGTNGVITYLPNGNFSGTDQFTYQICDNSTPTPQCDDADVTITVLPTYTDPCVEAVQAKTFYMPFPENETQLRQALYNASNNSTSFTDVVRNVTSIKSPYPNVIITYDEWEDGYENDITDPVQPSTKVWGDGNLTNGIAPGYPTDIIPAGGSIILDNNFIYNPRNPANIYYDGKDKLFSTSDLAISKITGDNAIFAIQAAKTDVYDVSRFGQLFVIGLGEIVGVPYFSYASVFIRAAEDDTEVSLDYDGDGNVDLTQMLDEGEVWFYEGDPDATDIATAIDIIPGAIVLADKPVGVDVLFGGNDNYGTRNINIFPARFYGDTYYSPVPTTNTNAPAVVYFTNALSTPITINWTSGTGSPSSGTLTVPGNGYNSLSLSNNSGYKFENLTGEAFTAVEILDADASGSAYDWAFSLISADRLTDFTSIAWAPGSLDGTRNDNPVWVTPTANTTIYVKFDGDLTGTGPNTSPCSLPYDVAVPLNALGYSRILDASDNDQSGLAVYTCDATTFAAVYGEDASTALSISPSLDVGTILSPKCLNYLVNAVDDLEVTPPNTPIIVGVSSNDFGFLCNVNPASITTTGLLAPSNGTIVINGDGTITYTPDPGFTGVETFEYRICAIEYPAVCDIATVTIRVTECDASGTENLINGKVYIEQLPDDGNYTDEAFAAGVEVDLYGDPNCNGVIDAGENIIQSTVSDLSGNYDFSVLIGYFAIDDFDPTASFSGNDGSVNWSSNWVEQGDNGVINTGDVQIIADAAPSGSGNAIRLAGTNNGISRSLSFSGATGAALKFSFRRQGLDDEGEAVLVQMNSSTVYTINDGDEVGTDNYYQQVIITLASGDYNANGNNTLQFITNGTPGTSDYFWIDDVELIYYTTPACYVVQVDPSNTGGDYQSALLNTGSASFSEWGTCDNNNYLGVLANLVAVDDSRNVLVDVPLVIDVLTNDITGKPDPSAVTTTGLLQPLHGTVIVNPDGTITYSPNPGYEGPDSFEYRVCSIDDPAVCDVALVNITVSCLLIPGQNTVVGLVYDDVDLDGTLDPGDPGHDNVSVEVYQDSNGDGDLDGGEPLLFTEATNGVGGYQFDLVPPIVTNTVRDEFNTDGSGAGNDGTQNWSGSWVEIGESDGFGSGDILVISNQLQVQDNDNGGEGAYRVANLSGASSATLSYSYDENNLDDANDYVTASISTDGTNWTTLATYSGADGNQSGTASYDISAYISSSTRVRFLGSPSLGGSDNVYFDNVEISYSSILPSYYIVQLATPLPTGFVQTSSPVFFPVSFSGIGSASCSKNFGLGGADLLITKVVDEPEPLVGSNITFTLTATNNGPSNATGVVVNDLLPAGYTYVSDNGGGAYVPGTGVWTVGNLNSGATATLTIVATVNLTGPYANTATIAGDQTDPDPGNNTDTETPEPLPATDLVVAKSVNNPTPYIGTNVVFTLVVTNNGPSPATGVVVSDLLPDGYTYVSDDGGGTYDDGSGIWTVGNLAATATATLEITATVNLTGSYENTATVSGEEEDPVPGNNTDSETTAPLASADLEVNKSVDNPTPTVGGTVVFTLVVTNNGLSAATGIIVNDQLPSGYTYVSDNGGGAYIPATGVWTIGNLAAGGNATLNITATVNATGDYQNTATVSGNEYDPVPGNNTDSETPVPVPIADLAITKADDSPVVIGEYLIYTVTVTNNGPSTAQNVQITDNLDANLGSPEYSTDNGVTWIPGWSSPLSIGALANGASYSVLIRGRVSCNVLSIQNSASVSSSTTDTNPLNNASIIVTMIEDLEPGTITGSTPPYCKGNTGVVFSIDPVTGATGYTWTVPSGTVITSGQGTSSITVTLGKTSGNVCVTVTNGSCTSAPQCEFLTIEDVPVAPEFK